MVNYECLILSKNGLNQNKWDSELREYVISPLNNVTNLSHLREVCVIDEGTTLLDIMKVVEGDDALKMVISQYSWCSKIDEFHIQAHEERVLKPPEDDMDCLEVYWHTSYHKQMLNIDTEFHGINSKGGTTTYSVSYSPIYELAHFPVVLNEDVSFYDKDKLLCSGKKHFTLLEVLDAIYWDISFMGGPEDNAEFLEEMNDRVESIENGDAEILNWDTIEKDENNG